ncbi:MAG: hypothetical protein KID00_03905, partial [Clostridium argentinense]|nr:hypothetical protein [Clostridium argentinense]
MGRKNSLSIFDKINISMYDPDRYLKKEVSATYQQHVIMKPTKTGNWTIRYTEPDNNTWSLWYIYDTNVLRNNNSIYESYSNGSFMGKTNTSLSYKTDKKIYAIPSENFKENSIEYSEINMQQLCNEMYDENNNRYVNSFKNFNINDDIYFKDVIEEINYNSNENSTSIKFKYKDELITWKFNGDLTSKYFEGDILSLRFKVVKEYEDNKFTFENINYIVESDSLGLDNVYPDIEEY